MYLATLHLLLIRPALIFMHGDWNRGILLRIIRSVSVRGGADCTALP